MGEGSYASLRDVLEMGIYLEYLESAVFMRTEVRYCSQVWEKDMASYSLEHWSSSQFESVDLNAE